MLSSFLMKNRVVSVRGSVLIVIYWWMWCWWWFDWSSWVVVLDDRGVVVFVLVWVERLVMFVFLFGCLGSCCFGLGYGVCVGV